MKQVIKDILTVIIGTIICAIVILGVCLGMSAFIDWIDYSMNKGIYSYIDTQNNEGIAEYCFGSGAAMACKTKDKETIHVIKYKKEK